jgi:hypothetical protein
LYKDGLHIDDQNEWIKDANEAMKRKLKDPDSIVVALQLEKKKRLRAKRNDIKHKDCLESTLGESIKAENKQLELLKQKSKADLNIAKLRNDTLESVNRKLKYKMETRNSVEPESTFTKT